MHLLFCYNGRTKNGGAENERWQEMYSNCR